MLSQEIESILTRQKHRMILTNCQITGYLLRGLFGLHDTMGKGIIKRDEFYHVMKNLKSELSLVEIHRIIPLILSEVGEISYERYLKYLRLTDEEL